MALSNLKYKSPPKFEIVLLDDGKAGFLELSIIDILD